MKEKSIINKIFYKNKERKLDWVCSTNMAELDFCFDVSFAFWALFCASGLWEDFRWYTEDFSEGFVVNQLFFVADFNIIGF